jgi:hypothetical protein
MYTGAQEFKTKFEEAMANNEPLLEAVEAAEGEGDEAGGSDDEEEGEDKEGDEKAEEELTKGLSNVEVKDE